MSSGVHGPLFGKIALDTFAVSHRVVASTPDGVVPYG